MSRVTLLIVFIIYNLPEPYSTLANLLADIIENHVRGKMTLQEIYGYLRQKYPDCFGDGGDVGHKYWEVLIFFRSRVELISRDPFDTGC